MKKNLLNIKDKSIAYSSQGTGNPVLLLHGFVESMEIWNDVAQELSQNHQVICIDLPGHGDSDMINEIHSMELMADIVKQVLDHLKIEKTAIVSHSMGGYVSLEFASRFSEMVQSLCLFHSHAAADPPEAKVNRDRAIKLAKENCTSFTTIFIPDLFAEENRKKFADEIKTLQQRASKMSAESIVASLEGMKRRKDHYETLKNADFKIGFILGKQDSRADMNIMKEQILLPKTSLSLIMDNCGHMGYLEQKESCINFLESFLQAD